MPKERWVNVDDYMNYQPPNTDRSTWTRSNEWSFGVGVDIPKRAFDEEKCSVCGGNGRIWVQKAGSKNERLRKQTSIPCPEQCKYVKNF